MNLRESFVVHNYLNPALWDRDNNLLPEVEEAILKITNRFRNDIDIPINICDIRLVGSNASYNYTEHSDLDVHLVINFESYLNSAEEITLKNMIASLSVYKFNTKYPNLSIHGVPVELYVQDVQSTTHSNGIYSVMSKQWIKFPEKLDSIPQIDCTKQVDKLSDEIKQLLNSNDLPGLRLELDKLYMLRRNGIDTEGEFSLGNCIFKQIRDLGLLQKVKDKITELKEKQLILENQNAKENK